MRFRCRCNRAMAPPTTTLVTPNPRNSVCITCMIAGSPAKAVEDRRNSPTMPIATIAPEKMTETGLGATECASGSQKWNGTCAAFSSKPVAISTNAASATGSPPFAATTRPIDTMSSDPASA